MFQSITKFNARVDRPQRLPDLRRQAFRVATFGTPGPVHIEMPGSHGNQVVREAAISGCSTRLKFARVAEDLGCLGLRVEKPSELSGALASALAAERPVVVDVVTDINALPAPPWS